MKRLYTLLAILVAYNFSVNAQDAKLITDCTVTYDVIIDNPNVPAAKSLAGTTSVLYIKGSKSRSDLEAANFKQSTIYDSKSDSTVILRESGNSKFISYLNGSKRKEKNKKYEGIQFSNTSEKKTILGYDCRKVIATLVDGTTYNIFYTPSIIPSNNDYEYQFKDLPGFVLEYEAFTEDGKSKIKYAASKISLVPVPMAKFDVPKSGYRVL